MKCAIGKYKPTYSSENYCYHILIISQNKVHCRLMISIFYLLSGPAAKYEFQAETRKLLDIVAKSLYSEREVGVFYMDSSF